MKKLLRTLFFLFYIYSIKINRVVNKKYIIYNKKNNSDQKEIKNLKFFQCIVF